MFEEVEIAPLNILKDTEKAKSPLKIVEASIHSENGSESAFEEPLSKKLRAKIKASKNRNNSIQNISQLKKYEFDSKKISPLRASSRNRPQR